MLDLLAAPLHALRRQQRRRWERRATAAPHERRWGEDQADYSGPPLHREPGQAAEGRPAARHRDRDAPPSSSRYGWAPRPRDTTTEDDESTPEPTVIDGVAHDLDATPGEDEASMRRSLREDVDRTLEQARDHLEPVVYGLFVNTGGGWLDRLNAARRKRRADLPAIDGAADVFHDRRVLFAVIAYDWSLIGHAFMRDPSRAGRALCAIANRYAHQGPHESDPAAARQAFGEICAALRPESVARVSWLFQPSR
jgi:hypothetical protein